MQHDSEIKESGQRGSRARVSNNPNCEIVEDYLTTDQAAFWLIAHGLEKMTVANLMMRRLHGKAPKFVKIGYAVGYREKDLREFLKTAGIRVNDDPPRSHGRSVK